MFGELYQLFLLTTMSKYEKRIADDDDVHAMTSVLETLLDRNVDDRCTNTDEPTVAELRKYKDKGEQISGARSLFKVTPNICRSAA